MDDYLYLQGEYLVMLYKNNNRYLTPDNIRGYREYIFKHLKSDYDETAKIQEELEKETRLRKKRSKSSVDKICIINLCPANVVKIVFS